MSRIWILFAALCAAVLALAAVQPRLGGLSTHSATTQNIAARTLAPSEDMDAYLRQYILAHPEVLMESVSNLRQRSQRDALAAVRPEIETPTPGTVAGNPRGDVTVVEYFDFRCPYCKMAATELENLMERDKNVRVIFRDMPVLDAPGREPLSNLASRFALAAAKQGKYKAFHDKLFALHTRLTREDLVAIVRSLNVNEEHFVRDAESTEVRKIIERNLQTARSIGIDATPGFVIGDQILIGAQRADELVEAVNAAREKVQSGE